MEERKRKVDNGAMESGAFNELLNDEAETMLQLISSTGRNGMVVLVGHRKVGEGNHEVEGVVSGVGKAPAVAVQSWIEKLREAADMLEEQLEG